MNNKKGISAVIATVLLIMLTVAAVALIAGVIIPFVKNQLDTSKKCFDITDQISIEPGKPTCYGLADTRVMIKRTSKNFELKGFIVSLRNATNSQTYRIYSNSETSGVKMYDNSLDLKIPEQGGAETYIFSISASYVSVAPILEGNLTCKEISENIPSC
jgi:flagellin-like protein